MMSTQISLRFVITAFACIAAFFTDCACFAEDMLSKELTAIVEVADARMKEGTAGRSDLIKIQIAVNYAKYKIEEISKEDLRKQNDPLENELMSHTRSAYKKRLVSTDHVLATIDFIVNHR